MGNRWSKMEMYGICGMVSPVVYTAMWILGGYLDPNYSHVKKDISSLLAVGAPHKKLMDFMNVSSCILNIIFTFGLSTVRHRSSKLFRPTARCLNIMSILGFLVSVFFPLDEGGKPISVSGKLHVLFVFGMAILCAMAMFLLYYNLKVFSTKFKGLSYFSLFSLILSIGSGIVSGMTLGGDYMGISERFAVSFPQLFLFVLASKVYSWGEGL